ncbi:MAG: ribose-5-phosphate isomerase RpiA [Polyangiaceae bacterium]|nr:ribose-5-phosphate isomerase RpiA [Polyangiaceae bacterium]
MDPKRRAAEAALELLPAAGTIGLGSGSTARLFIDGVGALVAAGRALRGVPTSEASRAQAEALGIPLAPDDGPWSIDVCVDGADEVSDALDLVKGGGGCHTREKIVNEAARLNVIVVDASKRSRRLGERWPVPLEILAFGRDATLARLASFGRVELRARDGAPWRSDAGNYLADLHAGTIDRPAELDARLRAIPGIVETGLFVQRADVVLVATADGVERLDRPAR